MPTAPADTQYLDTTSPANKPDASTANELNSPQLDDKGKPTRKAIDSATQAHSIAKIHVQRAEEGRLKTAGVISGKYGGEPPFDSAALHNTNQGWRNNFSTNFLASIVDRVKPQFLDSIKNSDLLTRSALPEGVEDGAKKSRKFCEIITRTIRRWSGWDDCLSMISQEDVVFGVATPGWIDDNWRPRVWRFDESYLPEGTGQHASKAQLWVAKQSILLHEFIDLIADRDAAELAQWNIEGCVKAVNRSTTGRQDSTNPVAYQDAIRENAAMPASYGDKGQIKTVNLYHVLVREYAGGVDLWTVTQEDGYEIRHVEHLHDDMEDALTLFTLQTGNTKFYGSKGLGRLLTNLHIAIERGRCLAMDQVYLSGLVILLADSGKFNSLQPIVRHPFVIVDKEATVSSEQIAFDAQAFDLIDNKLVQLAESIAGAFIPPNLETGGSPNTKIEAAQKAEREIAVRQGVLGRFSQQFSDMIGGMQRKICCEDALKEGQRLYEARKSSREKGLKVIARKVWKLLKAAMGTGGNGNSSVKYAPDPESKVADQESVDAIVEMLEAGLTLEEIATLATSSAAEHSEPGGADADSATVQFIQANTGNPLLNTVEAFKMSGEILIGGDRTNRLILPQDDPTLQAVATRQQLIELGQMMDGTPMPVAATDEHSIHRSVIAGQFGPLMDGMAKGVTPPTLEILKTAQQVVAHYLTHLQMDRKVDPEQAKQEQQMMQQWQQVIAKSAQALMKTAQQTQTAPGAVPQPPPTGGTVPQVGPDGNVTGAPPQDTALQDSTDIAVKIHGQSLRERDQALREQQHQLDLQKQAHKEQVDILNATTGAAKVTADAALEGQRAGMQDAEKDLSANS